MIQIDIENRQNKVAIFSIIGDFQMADVEYAESQWNNLMMSGPKVIAINGKKLDYIDSSAIGLLVKFFKKTLDKNIDLVFIDLSQNVRHIFQTAKLSSFFKVITRNKFETDYMS